MSSKEALESIKQCCYEYLQEFQNIEQVKFIGNCFMQLEQDLERLETLETSVLEYRDQEQLYWQTNENNVKLRDENEKLKKDIQNEIELLIERRFNAYACDDYQTHNILNTIIEELREVLDNENPTQT